MTKARFEVLRDVLTKTPSSWRLYHIDCGISIYDSKDLAVQIFRKYTLQTTLHTVITRCSETLVLVFIHQHALCYIQEDWRLQTTVSWRNFVTRIFIIFPFVKCRKMDKINYKEIGENVGLQHARGRQKFNTKYLLKVLVKR